MDIHELAENLTVRTIVYQVAILRIITFHIPLIKMTALNVSCHQEVLVKGQVHRMWGKKTDLA